MYTDKAIQFSFKGEELIFRCVRASDVSPEYIKSLNNEHKYLETKSEEVSVATQQEYISLIEASEDRMIFGIFRGDELIATSGAQAGDGGAYTLGIFIFDNWRGRGLGKVLVYLACTQLRGMFRVEVVKAGMKRDNEQSLRCFLKCGFKVVDVEASCFKVELLLNDIVVPHSLVLHADAT